MEYDDSVYHYAISAESIYKKYGKLPVLQGTSLKVKRGHIYGLLGPSGCGKTTLLKCVIGFLKIDGGSVRVLGNIPGTVGSGIPGSVVGYMPQELALFDDFTICQTMLFFGRVHGMSRKNIDERIIFLLKFLDLPEQDRRIDRLSGGQKRRVSLAIALLHSPRILILDEPTVGVDPVLRQRIWEHLLHISKTLHTTIIITTHYIEEARSADMVGLMRQGKLLAEGSPDELLVRYQKDSLENTFLHLCMQDDTAAEQQQDGTDKDVLIVATSHSQEPPPAPRDHPAGGCYRLRQCTGFLPKPRNVWALFIKDVTLLLKKIPFMLFQFLLPMIQISLFSLCVGGKPFNLQVAVVNEDAGFISSMFLDALSNKTLSLQHYTDIGSAKDDIRAGNLWALLYINSSFTEDMILRYTQSPLTLNRSIIEGSNIKVWMDMTNQQISITITEELTDAFEKLPSMMHLPGSLSNSSLLPLEIEDPIYGLADPSFLDFMAPGIIINIVFFMATGLTALSFVLEKKEGLLERSLVSGVNMVEIMMGHVLTQFLTMSVQVAVLLVTALAIFNIHNEGSLVLLVILTLFQGFTGMALGLLISAVSKDERSAIQSALATVFPSLLISGILWPVEAMPEWLRYISDAMPLTFSAQAFRCIMGRGWDLYHYEVWRGFVVCVSWGWGLCILAALKMIISG